MRYGAAPTSMSHDVIIHASSRVPPPVAEMPNDWSWDPLGAADDVRRRISEALPNVDWSDPAWGTLDEPCFEFNLGDEDPVVSCMVHIRGGADPMSRLFELAQSADWFILDCSAGEWLHHSEDTNAGWEQFQSYRAHVPRRTRREAGE